jgi:predicted ABC-class ATPase
VRINEETTETLTNDDHMVTLRNEMVHQFLNNLFHQITSSDKLMEHVACNVFQHKMRQCLEQQAAIAFIANGSILPRKSGASQHPMSSPPAIPFQAPNNNNSITTTSMMTQKTILIPMGLLQSYLPSRNNNNSIALWKDVDNDMVSISGLLIPKGE